MSTFLFYLIMLGNGATALFFPWIGMVLAYVIAIFAPQAVWWWVFAGTRPYLFIVVPAMAGFSLAALTGRVRFSILNTRINLLLGLLWIFFTVSYYFGPYVHVFNQYRFYDPGFMFSELTKTYLTYFVAAALFDETRRLKVASLVIVVTVLYMTYWANSQYFVHHVYGRLHGPRTLQGAGIYADQNNFAVLFVVGAPFVYYLGRYLNRRAIKWVTWLVIPLTWHAVFLTASRGALLGIAATLCVFTLRQKRRAFGLIIVAFFALAFTLEAGSLMKDRSSTIVSYQDDNSAEYRIDAWKAAIGMMEAHPITGVGFASFGQAFPDFSNIPPRVAHNTFFQIGGEWGVPAGLDYLVLMLWTMNKLRKNGIGLRDRDSTDDMRFYYCLNESCLLGLCGFFVCSMFLSLQGYDVLYYLLLMANAVLLFPRIASPKVLPIGVVASAERLPAVAPATMESPLPRRGYGHQDDKLCAGRTHQRSPATRQRRNRR